ncbi:excinuclease ABC subunit UvrA [Dissulfurimicrobium hydrothermale]|uniref:excinuclease ABC subunit UvrA n=1 Tax=Dissulfurimicrobium hydrothermale TaxID=1750598 RepID=UPI001EDA4F15|nr:excinuclease ABC subunit UvrA [Dissulfurimicrobium hydrothermale]UKL13807.1 excinuclease ABC subunit UvrA [Dissulfurimicrobium hydrothermale]
MPRRYIEVVNASEHNLKGINVSIPIDEITVITGPSGSGKSTLALDVLFAEGQRRYIESLGIEAKLDVNLWERPHVEEIRNLPPPLAFEQKPIRAHPASTVATASGISHLLKLLFVNSGSVYCPVCGDEIRACSPQEMAKAVIGLGNGAKVNILASIDMGQNAELNEVVNQLRREGLARFKVDGAYITADDTLPGHTQPKELCAVIDRIIIKDGIFSRLTDSLTIGLKYGKGRVIIEALQDDSPVRTFKFSEEATCARCNISLPMITRKVFSTRHPDGMCNRCRGHGVSDKGETCRECEGTGLGRLALNIRIKNWRYPDTIKWLIEEALTHLKAIKDDTSGLRNPEAAKRLCDAIISRIKPMIDMGIQYLPLNRSIGTLSGGEVQRLKISTQLGLDLTGILYILDEPMAGLHPREQDGLWRNLERLKAKGNTIVMVEHDIDTIRRAGWLVELGPGAGELGGRLIYQGQPDKIKGCAASNTARYLDAGVCYRRAKRHIPHGVITIRDAKENNLKDITCTIPLGVLACITGVSGSGKSTLMEILYRGIRTYRTSREDTQWAIEIALLGLKSKGPNAVIVEQSCLAKTRFSMPATYMGIFPHIRMLFANTPEARARGYSSGYFSLMHKGGRCEQCQGKGVVSIDLGYLAPFNPVCDVCEGTRYNQDALSIRYRGLNISEVLGLSITEAAQFFSRIPDIRRTLQVLERIGLGYLRLGQPLSNISGGEAQRLKLARELSSASRNRVPTIYLMDEPSRGLHPSDLENLIGIIDELIDQGNSFIAIEHKIEILAVSDWIVELGPEGGPEGGRITAEGTPADIIRTDGSSTAPYFIKYNKKGLG